MPKSQFCCPAGHYPVSLSLASSSSSIMIWFQVGEVRVAITLYWTTIYSDFSHSLRVTILRILLSESVYTISKHELMTPCCPATQYNYSCDSQVFNYTTMVLFLRGVSRKRVPRQHRNNSLFHSSAAGTQMHTPLSNQLNGTINPVSTLYFLLFTFIISSGATPQCPPLYEFTGETVEDNLGFSVASVLYCCEKYYLIFHL